MTIFKNTAYLIVLLNSFLAYGTQGKSAAPQASKKQKDEKKAQRQVFVNYAITTTHSKGEPTVETMSAEEWEAFEFDNGIRNKTIVDEKKAKDLAQRQTIIDTIFDTVKKGNLKAVQEFVETYKQNVNTADKKGNTLLMLAVEYLKTPIVDYLLARKDINSFETNQLGNTALHTAVTTAMPRLVQKILGKQREQDEKKAADTLVKALHYAKEMKKSTDDIDDEFNLNDGYSTIVKYLEEKYAELLTDAENK
jgi:hypothetical protein